MGLWGMIPHEKLNEDRSLKEFKKSNGADA
jgi:hypothetical protein